MYILITGNDAIVRVCVKLHSFYIGWYSIQQFTYLVHYFQCKLLGLVHNLAGMGCKVNRPVVIIWGCETPPDQKNIFN